MHLLYFQHWPLLILSKLKENLQGYYVEGLVTQKCTPVILGSNFVFVCGRVGVIFFLQS